MKKMADDKGLTLVEVLVAITLLSIVFLFFLNFFPKAMVFSGKSEDRLTAINLAEKMLVEEKKDNVNYTGTKQLIDGQPYDAVEPVDINNKTYYPYVLASLETPEDLNLLQIHVLIFANEDYDSISNNKPETELFGYKKWGGQ